MNLHCRLSVWSVLFRVEVLDNIHTGKYYFFFQKLVVHSDLSCSMRTRCKCMHATQAYWPSLCKWLHGCVDASGDRNVYFYSTFWHVENLRGMFPESNTIVPDIGGFRISPIWSPGKAIVNIRLSRIHICH